MESAQIGTRDDERRLRVVGEACSFADDLSRGTVVVESEDDGAGGGFADAIENLQSARARTLAIAYAARSGMSDPRVNGIAGRVYPVNSSGVVLDQVDPTLPHTHPDRQVYRYRAGVPLTRKPV